MLKGGLEIRMTRSIGYPATNQDEANARARVDAEENGWVVVESRWYPHLLDDGGVLVVQIGEPKVSADPLGCPRVIR